MRSHVQHFSVSSGTLSAPGSASLHVAGLACVKTGKTILIVDDHPLMRGALGETIRHLEPSSTLHFADSRADALARLSDTPALDLILLDLRLGDSIGLEALLALREAAPQVPLVVLSGETQR
jgi:DNA-binding NarL/FixJ family response regulator